MSREDNSSLPKKPKKAPVPTQTALRVERAQVTIPHAGLAFDHRHQIFIAKLKRGEVWALNQLSFQAKAAVTPLFEMWPPNPGTTNKPGKTLIQHTADLLQTVMTEWIALPFYLDTQYLQSGGEPSPAAAQTVFGIARTMNLSTIPVTSPFAAQPFQEAIRDVITLDGRGVMFRLTLNCIPPGKSILFVGFER
jgi:hypothetical protein